jgi:hypothetical protein
MLIRWCALGPEARLPLAEILMSYPTPISVCTIPEAEKGTGALDDRIAPRA